MEQPISNYIELIAYAIGVLLPACIALAKHIRAGRAERTVLALEDAVAAIVGGLEIAERQNPSSIGIKTAKIRINSLGDRFGVEAPIIAHSVREISDRIQRVVEDPNVPGIGKSLVEGDTRVIRMAEASVIALQKNKDVSKVATKNYSLLILAVSAVAILSVGCSAFQSVITPNSEIYVREDFQSLAKIVKALPDNAGLGDLVVPLRVDEIKEPALDADGKPMFSPNGGVVYTTRTITESGLPQAPGRTTLQAGDEFVKSKISFRMDKNSDGSGIEFNQETDVEEGAYKSGVVAQTTQMATSWNGIGTVAQSIEKLGMGFIVRLSQLDANQHEFAMKQLEYESIASAEPPSEEE